MISEANRLAQQAINFDTNGDYDAAVNLYLVSFYNKNIKVFLRKRRK